jgi:cytochrome c peroxidase
MRLDPCPTRAPRHRLVSIAFCLLSSLLAACGGGGGSEAASANSAAPPSATAALGEKIFSDASLSASGRQSCASCHDPAAGHAPANALAVQLGGALDDQQGLRKAPSLRYLAGVAPFALDAEGTPSGGLFWDGRAATLADQAGEPLLNPLEMANPDKAAVVAKLSRASYADEFRRVFGDAVFDDVEGAFRRLTLALQRYQLEDAAFRGYSSRYDAFLRGEAPLSTQELRGLALFNAPGKGNCAACHPSARGADGALPLFTDFSYDNLGVPRNADLERNADPAYFDLGLCQRAELAARTDLCGAFRVPSLRNVAERKAFFHNGRFKSLKETISFYVQRDTNPEKWYAADANGEPIKFDDLPAAYHANVNTSEAPYDRRRGDAPALSDAEIDDVIAFLQTLSDNDRQP